jgi:putative ABC transport system permease protein
MLGDYFRLALANIFQRRKRSFLTIVGIFIGIAAIVALVSLGEGMKGFVAGQFETLGKDKITVLASSGFGSSPLSSSANPITITDLETVRKTRGIMQAADVLMKPAIVDFGDQTKNTIIVGYPLDDTRKIFEDTGGYSMRDGRQLRPNDGRKAVLGSYVADKLFEHKVRVGQSIRVQGIRYDIVGIFDTTGDPTNDRSVFVPLKVMRDDFNEPKLVSMIFAQTQPGEVPADVAAAVKEKLRSRRGEKEGGESFSVSTSEQLLETFNTIFGVIQMIVLGLAAISLIVGGIGIMNTMYTSVLERTKEIGTMKAVGARNSDVLTLFVIESALLGMVGGLLGVLTGFGLSKIVETVARQALGTATFTTFFPLELIAGAMLFSIGIGTISGVLPAMQASRMKPVDALRYE